MSALTDLNNAVNAFVAAQNDSNAAQEAAISELQTILGNQGVDALVEAQVAVIVAATNSTKAETLKLKTALDAISAAPAPVVAPVVTPAAPPAVKSSQETTPVLDQK